MTPVVGTGDKNIRALPKRIRSKQMIQLKLIMLPSLRSLTTPAQVKLMLIAPENAPSHNVAEIQEVRVDAEGVVVKRPQPKLKAPHH